MLNIIFAGTPDFAAVALEALIKAGHNIVAVYTQPDRPSGRGQKMTASAVKTTALAHGLTVYQPIHLKSNTEEGLAAQDTLKALNADVMVVAAYGLILPLAVLDIPKLGCLNIHASLLPRWRGAAPIHRAILAGDSETGITIMQMDVGLDTGDMLYKTTCPILNTDTTATLHEKLAQQGGQAIVHTLAHLAELSKTKQVQDESLVTYAHKITKAEAKIDWTQSATELDKKIRGFNPNPIAYFELDGQNIRVWSAIITTIEAITTPTTAPTTTNTTNAGEIISIDKHGVSVCCGDGKVITLTSLQWPGGKVLNSLQILQVQKLSVGQQLQGLVTV